jgi:hypothetical protein
MLQSKTILVALLSLGMNTSAVTTSNAMPHEYEDESTPLASPPELNLIYGSIPHGKDEKFNILARVDTPSHNGLPKYMLIYRHSSGTPRGYLIIRLDTNGIKILSETPENPFAKGDISDLKFSMPILAASSLYKQCLGYISAD